MSWPKVCNALPNPPAPEVEIASALTAVSPEYPRGHRSKAIRRRIDLGPPAKGDSVFGDGCRTIGGTRLIFINERPTLAIGSAAMAVQPGEYLPISLFHDGFGYLRRPNQNSSPPHGLDI